MEFLLKCFLQPHFSILTKRLKMFVSQYKEKPASVFRGHCKEQNKKKIIRISLTKAEKNVPLVEIFFFFFLKGSCGLFI